MLTDAHELADRRGSRRPRPTRETALFEILMRRHNWISEKKR
jgi:hypothetical protein